MNEIFLKRMRQFFPKDYEAYLETLSQPAYRGLRINTLKVDVEAFSKECSIPLGKTGFCPTSFYLDRDIDKVGKHPLHLAGCFYLQEPSAASAVVILNPQKGDWVLDLCAAPGGKSTQIAACLDNTGFLLSNEIEHKRAQILVSNLERMGVSENMITSAHPQQLCEACQGWFDKVLVDAPCSGEGMFKIHAKAMEDWSEEHVLACANRQSQILDSAYLALKQDGILVYSTCTYAIEENEQVIANFIKRHPDMELLPCAATFGREGIANQGIDERKVCRILPMDEGEGHFIAKLKKHGKTSPSRMKFAKEKQLPEYVENFLHSQLDQFPKVFFQQQDRIYAKQTPFIELTNIHILRQGVYCGDCVKNRFEPHQHFYTCAILREHYLQVYELKDETECQTYLQGNQLFISGYKGYVVITYLHHPLGFGKGDGNVIKNKYPKGLRI